MLAIAARLCVYRIAQLSWIGFLCCMKWLKACVAVKDTPDSQSRRDLLHSGVGADCTRYQPNSVLTVTRRTTTTYVTA